VARTHTRPVRYGAAVYGSFLVAAVVGVAFEAGESARAMTASAFGSMLIFWLAHVWSEILGETIAAEGTFRYRDALVIAGREWPLVEAAILPTLLLALAWAGVWSRETGAMLALGTAVLQITGWGVVAGRRSGGSWLSAGLLGLGQGMLGVLLLGLERFVH
jgi:hypothetical protein